MVPAAVALAAVRRYRRVVPPTARRIFALVLLACCVPALASDTERRPSRRRPPSQVYAPDLIGSEWLLEDLCGRGVVGDAHSTLAFPGTGKVAGNGGCNRYFGVARINGDRIQVEHVASTRMACAPPILDQEHRFLGALQKAKRLEIDGETLLIHSAGCAKPLKFSRLAGQGEAPAKPHR